MNNTETARVIESGGVSFSVLLTILFIALKVTGVIDWSWLWVLSPLWISFSLFLFILLTLIVGLTISETVKIRRIRKRLKNRKL